MPLLLLLLQTQSTKWWSDVRRYWDERAECVR